MKNQTRLRRAKDRHTALTKPKLGTVTTLSDCKRERESWLQAASGSAGRRSSPHQDDEGALLLLCRKGWYTAIDEGDEPQREPDLLVWELSWQVRRLEDGTVTRTVDPERWKMPPFHVEAETYPTEGKPQVIMNYEKAWALKRYVVFAVPSKQDADDLKKIMDEIGAPSGSYEIDDISDLLAE